MRLPVAYGLLAASAFSAAAWFALALPFLHIAA